MGQLYNFWSLDIVLLEFNNTSICGFYGGVCLFEDKEKKNCYGT